ncbi:MAG: M48 family metalloprotease [Archangiaceae bacterium]|nr:M48 family metalloprotease [Archangiaceae bacterium]
MAYERSRNSGGARLLIGLVIAGISVLTYFSRRTTNELTGETQYVKLTEQQEVSLGLSSAPQLTRQFGGATSDSNLAQYVTRVGQRVATRSAAAKTKYPFKFTVLADRKTINAFALPGGPVFITEALLSRMTNEAQLAGVLGHEIGHVVARHGAEHLAKADLTAGLVGATVVATSDPDRPGDARAKAALAAATAQLITMKFGRDDELESDRLGVRFMHEAGYDAAQMGEVMKVLKAAGGGRTPEFFSTHPDPENRLEQIAAALKGLPAGGELGADEFRTNVLERTGASAPREEQVEAPPEEAPLPKREKGATESTIKISQLPDEARDTLKLIESNGPYPFDRDGIEFKNREGKLPYRPGGYYREYTVITPGERTRGARRIVTGANGERYYSDDHYQSFSRLVP